MRDIEALREEFERIGEIDPSCIDGACSSEEEIDLKDYPSFTEALYAKLVAPYESGIYLSRWDIKNIALAAGDSMAIHPRKRMFELLMKYASNRENMERVLDALELHMEEKVNIYKELMQKFPTSKEVFQPKVDKAERTIRFLPKILDEYFSEGELY
jgi:hypothetical protein